MKKNLIKCIAFAATIPFFSCELPKISAEDSGKEKLIALTFDDGPNTTTTNDILDLLETYHAKASFFLIGENIQADSAVAVKRAYDMGCEIDNHSKSHSNMGGMSPEALRQEIQYVDERVTEITGEPTKFFRPPFIDVSQTMYDEIDLPFICGLGCNDFMEDVSAQERSDFLVNNAADGVIFLLHDAAGNQKTVEALKTAIPALLEKGFEFVTLTELFERQGEVPQRNMLYSRVVKYPCKGYQLHKNLFTGEATGDSSWSGWGETAVLDAETLENLGENYAIEVQYSCQNPPVIALQKWNGTAIWATVQPYYANGKTACFLAQDLLQAMKEYQASYADFDRISIVPFSGTLTLTQVDFLLPMEDDPQTEVVPGDINQDGSCDIADAVLLQKHLLCESTEDSNLQAGDMNADSALNATDLTILKQKLLKGNTA